MGDRPMTTPEPLTAEEATETAFRSFLAGCIGDGRVVMPHADLAALLGRIDAARSLAAELVEGLERITSVGEEYCHDDFMADAVDRASALIAKARAAGIAPKGEKGETHD